MEISNMKCALVGFGATGRMLLGMIQQLSSPKALVLFDDNAVASGVENAKPFAGFLDPAFSDFCFFVPLGYLHLPRKREIIRSLRSAGRRVPPFLHPSAYVHPTCRIAKLPAPGAVPYPLLVMAALFPMLVEDYPRSVNNQGRGKKPNPYQFFRLEIAKSL